MPFDDRFFQQTMPAVNAYLGMPPTGVPPPAQQGLIPGVANTGLGQVASVRVPPPPGGALPPGADANAPPGDPLVGGYSLPPPPPAETAGPGSYLPPAPPKPAPAAPPQTQLVKMGGAAAREVPTIGPVAAGLINRAEQERLQGAQEATEVQKTALLHQAMAAQASYDESAAQAQGAQEAMANHQRQMADARARMDQAMAAPGPQNYNDYWTDKGIGAHIGMALSAGLAAMGMAIARQSGPNPVLQMLEHSIDTDLKMKQMRYENQAKTKQGKVDDAQSQFNNMVRQFGMDPAKDLWAAKMRDASAAKLAMNSAAAGIPEADANLAKMQSDIRAQADEHKANAFLKYVPPSAAQAAYVHPDLGVPMTRKEYLEYVEKRSLEGQQQTGRIELEGLKSRGKPNEGAKFIAEKLQSANIPRTVSAVEDAQKDYAQGPGGQPADTSGVGLVGRFVQSTPIIGALAYRTLYGEKASEREQNWGILKGEILKSLEGRVSPQLYEKQQQILDGAKTADARRHILDTMSKQLATQENVIKAGAGPEAAATFDQNRQEIAPPPLDVRPVE